MRVLGFLCLLLLLGLVPQPVYSEPPQGYQFMDFDQGLAKSKSSKKKIFLYFGREGCGYCEVTNKTAFSKSEVKQRYQDHYELVYVDSESGRRLSLPSGERVTERELGARFKAFVTPVFLFMSPDGKSLLKRVGIQKPEQLLAYDNYVFSGAYQKQSFDEFQATQP